MDTSKGKEQVVNLLINGVKRVEPSLAVNLLTLALEAETEAVPRRRLLAELTTKAEGLQPAEAARVLTQALKKEKDEDAQITPAGGEPGTDTIPGTTEYSPPSKEPVSNGRKTPADAAVELTKSLEKETDSAARIRMACKLVDVIRQLSPTKDGRACASALQVLLNIAKTETKVRYKYILESEVAMVIQNLDSELASSIAEQLAFEIYAAPDVNGTQRIQWIVPELYNRPPPFDACLTNASQHEISLRASAAATASGLSGVNLLGALPALAQDGEPLPCRLSTQALVELLKMPTCFGPVRQVVLKHLGNRYGRPFANHWEFVRFAQEQHLDFDFTSPPKRPSRP